MPDSRLQDLKRAWEASGSVEAEAAYLRERVRVGDLTQERLELAAYCGHEGALIASGERPTEVDDLEAWAENLGARGKEVGVRLAVAVGDLLLPALEEIVGYDPRPKEALQAAKAWVRCPCDLHARAAFDVQDPAIQYASERSRADRDAAHRPEVWNGGNAIWAVARAADRPANRTGAITKFVLTTASRVVSAEKLRAVISSTLCEWALLEG